MKLRKLIYAAALMFGVVACGEEIPTDIQPNVSEGRLSLVLSSVSERLAMSESGSEGEVVFLTRGGELFVDVVTNVAEWNYNVEGGEWLSVEADKYGLLLSADMNVTDSRRVAEITFSASRGKENAAVVLRVVQNHAGVPEIEAVNNSLRIKAHSELQQSVEIVTNQDEWSFDCTCSWLLIEKSEGALVLTADDNVKIAQREAQIILSAGVGESVCTDVLTVRQDGNAFITLASYNIATDDEGATKRLEIVSNPELDWDFAIGDCEWVKAERDENDLVVTILPNEVGLERFGSVTIVVGEEDNSATATLKVHQIGTDTDELIYEIEVTETPYIHTAAPVLSSSGGGLITVDWGDGSEAEVFDSRRGTHTYTKAGFYTISITGNCKSLEFGDGKSLCPEVKNIISWGTLGYVNAADMCLGCSGLESIPNDVAGSFKNVKSFVGAFSICTSLKEIPAGLFRYATLAKKFEDCFSHAGKITEIPENLFANCTAAEDFSYAFYATGTGIVETTQLLPNFEEVKGLVEAGGLKSIPEGLFRNCAAAKEFNYVFGATAIEAIPESLFANNSAATTFEGAFSACVKLGSIPVGVLSGATAATNIKYMFAGCEGVSAIPVGMFANNSAVTNLEYIFFKTGVNSLSKGVFEGLTSVKTMGAVFYDCVNLSEIEEGVFDGLSSVKSFKYCFSGCTSLKSIPSGLFKGLTTAYEFCSTFEDTALESIPADLFADARDYSSADFSYMLAGCKNLKTVPAGLFDKFTTVTSPGFKYTFTQSGIETIPEGLFAKNVKVSSGFDNTFYYCESLETIEGPIFPESSTVSSLAYTFAGCKALKSLPEGLFDSLAASKTKFTATFALCTSLETLPSGLFTKNTLATNFSNAFNSCTALREIPEDLIGNNEKVGYVTSMFDSCYSLEAIPAGLFAGCPAITSFEATFALCSSLESIPAELFAAIGTKTSSVTFSECFLDCVSLKTVPVSLFDTVKRINYIDKCFSGCTSLTGESPYTVVTNADGEEVKIHLYERTRGDVFPVAPTSSSAHTDCFADCEGLSDYADIPADWK